MVLVVVAVVVVVEEEGRWCCTSCTLCTRITASGSAPVKCSAIDSHNSGVGRTDESTSRVWCLEEEEVKGAAVSSSMSMELIEDMERKRATWRRGLSLRCLTISLIDL